MPAQKTPLEQLIDFPRDGESAERRELMRLCTDRLLAAPDRYGIREMEFFDLLYSNTARQMDTHTRKLMIATLAKAGLPREKSHALIMAPPSMLGQILRRSATQTMPDLVDMIRDKTRSHFGPNALAPAGEIHLPEHRFTLPAALLAEMFCFIRLSITREAVSRGQGKLAPLIAHSVRLNGQRLIEESSIEARDAILEARTAVQRRIRERKMNEAFLEELLATGHSLQFTLGLTHMLDVDTTTILRILNDATWESLAIACRASRISRSAFSKFVNSMHKREDDKHSALRIMGLYEKLPRESADRVMRFWQVRVSALKEMSYDDDFTLSAPPANNNEAAPASAPAPVTNSTGKSFGRR